MKEKVEEGRTRFRATPITNRLPLDVVVSISDSESGDGSSILSVGKGKGETLPFYASHSVREEVEWTNQCCRVIGLPQRCNGTQEHSCVPDATAVSCSLVLSVYKALQGGARVESCRVSVRSVGDLYVLESSGRLPTGSVRVRQ
jgi:hypothetical protein